VLILVSTLYLCSPPPAAKCLLTYTVLAVVLENLYPILGLPIKNYRLRGIFTSIVNELDYYLPLPLIAPTEGAPPLVFHPSENRGRSLKWKYAVLGRLIHF